MSNLTVQLDGDALREATTQAILGVLTPEVKAKLLENAVVALLKPSTDSWNRNKSPLEVAFDDAIVQVARAEAKQLVAEDAGIQTKVKELLRTTADKILSADVDKLTQRMADAFVTSIRRD